MNLSHVWTNSGRLAPDLLKCASTVLLGIGAGVVTTMYSPFFAFTGTLVFSILAISLYISSYYRHTLTTTVTSEATLPIAARTKSGVLFYLFYLSFFLSITIPKSGKTIANIPITIANILILFTMGCWLMAYIFSKKPKRSIPLSKPIILFILCGIMAVLIGFIKHNSRRYIILDLVTFIGFIPGYFLVCNVLQTKDQIRKITQVVVISSFLVCGYGVLQPRIGFERMTVPGITEQYGKIMYQGVGRWNVIEGGAKKVYSTFQNGNIFGNHLATFIPFLGGILIGLPASKKRLLLAGVFLLSCYALILTYSRGALAGTIGGILVLAFIAKKIRFKAIIVVLLILSVFLIFLYQYSDRPELVRYDIRRIMADPDRFSAGRLERTKQVLAGFYRLPFSEQVFGKGFGGVLISPLGWRFEYVDNLYLTLLFKMGIVGLAILIVMLVLFFSRLLKLRSRTPDLYFQGLITGGIAGLVSSLIHNFADTLWFFPPLSANFWFLAGITMSIAVLGSQNFESDEHMRGAPQQAKGKGQRAKGKE
jgi:O-antigen ligase